MIHQAADDAKKAPHPDVRAAPNWASGAPPDGFDGDGTHTGARHRRIGIMTTMLLLHVTALVGFHDGSLAAQPRWTRQHAATRPRWTRPPAAAIPAAAMPARDGENPDLLAAFREAVEADGLVTNEGVNQQFFTDGIKRVAHRTLAVSGLLAGVAFLSYVLVPALALATIALQFFGLAACSVYGLSCALRAVIHHLSCRWRGEEIPPTAADAVVESAFAQKPATEYFADFEYRMVIGGTTREADRTEADRIMRMGQLRDNVARAAHGL